MNRIQWWAGLGLAVCLSACGHGGGGFGPGYSDFRADLVHGYRLIQFSSHDVEIGNQRAPRDTGIDAKVVSLCFDDRFILAQQQLLDATDDPVRGKYQYWIIDATAQKRFGPFTEVEFNAQRKALGVSDQIKLRGTDSYRP